MIFEAALTPFLSSFAKGSAKVIQAFYLTSDTHKKCKVFF